MKESASKKKEPRKLSPTATKYALLIGIREADLPRDQNKFMLQELKDAGLDKGQRDGMSESRYKLLLLFTLQNRELRKDRDRLQERVAQLEPFHSPLWDEARVEPDPLKQKRLEEQARDEETKVAADRKAVEDAPVKALLEAIRKKTIPFKQWEDRDLSRAPTEAVFWHKPMTLMDYHAATGLSRRTLLNILGRLGASPLEPDRHRKNTPARYGRETNTLLLCEWLVKYQKDPEARRAWLARTLYLYQASEPTLFNRIRRSLKPVLLSLDIRSPEQIKEFVSYLSQCHEVLAPRYSPFKASVNS